MGSLLTLARFSEAFLILRAQDVGLPTALTPLVLVVMNIVYAISAYPIGSLSDRMSRRTLLATGFGVLIAADLVLGSCASIWSAMLGAALWGLHMGITQGLLSALVADTAPGELRGTAFGLFHLTSGIALLLASLIAGALWEAAGAQATFFAGVGLAALGLLGMLMLRKY